MSGIARSNDNRILRDNAAECISEAKWPYKTLNLANNCNTEKIYAVVACINEFGNNSHVNAKSRIQSEKKKTESDKLDAKSSEQKNTRSLFKFFAFYSDAQQAIKDCTKAQKHFSFGNLFDLTVVDLSQWIPLPFDRYDINAEKKCEIRFPNNTKQQQRILKNYVRCENKDFDAMNERTQMLNALAQNLNGSNKKPAVTV